MTATATAPAASGERVPFMDLAQQWRQIEAAAMPELRQLFEQSAFVLGPWVDRFEKNVAAYTGVEHAVGVNSGTSALHLAMIAAGVGPGDKVLLPANTFMATAWGVLYVGAEPVLCDVRPDTWEIDLEDAERRMSKDVKAIIPVHLYGQPADMDAVMAFAARHDLKVIEDAAQAIGAHYKGEHVGGRGLVGCFSFYPGKNLGAAGEAGLLVTRDAAIADRMRALRHHAQPERYVHSELGFNYRMDGIQGLILDHKLKLLDAWTDERRDIARRFSEGLAGAPLELPTVGNGDHVWHLYVVHTPQRDALKQHLSDLGIETGVHYPIPLHRQRALAHLQMDRDSFPNAERNGRECLTLPLFVGMSDRQVDRVIEGVLSFFA